MATNQVQIEITAIDKAGGVLDKIQVELKQTAQAAEKSGKTAAGGMNLFGKSLGDIKSLALGVVAPIAGLGAAIGTVKKFVLNSINDWAAYNEEIRKFSIATGAAPEDISRMMQAADDLGVSMEALGTAFSYASRNGVTPTISNMAKLSDELLAIKDPAERAQLAMKIFGRGWVEVAPFVLAGSEAIRDGAAAINENMVATEESIQKSREYTVAVDNLSDAWTGFANTVGGKALPAVTDLLVKLTEGTQELIDQESRIAGLTNVQEQATKAYKDGALSIKQYNTFVNEQLWQTEKVSDAQDKLNYLIGYAKDGYYRAGAQLVQLNRVEAEAVTITDDLGESTAITAKEMGELAAHVRRAWAGIEQMKSKKIDIRLGFQFPSGDIDTQIQNWFNSEKWTAAGGKAIEDAMANIKSLLLSNAITEDEASDMFANVFLASQQIQMDLDLIDASTAADNIKNTLGKSATEAWNIVRALKRDASFTANAYINIHTRYVQNQKYDEMIAQEERLRGVDLNNNGVIGRAIGGPVMPSQMYMVGERGPELFVPNTPGTIVPNGAAGGVSYSFGDIIINAGGGQSPEAIARALINQINRQTRASRNAGLGYVS